MLPVPLKRISVIRMYWNSHKIWKRVDWERLRMFQFVRFQKAADGTFFAAFEPQHNALPLTIEHFKDRFADQKWLIYDMKTPLWFLL